MLSSTARGPRRHMKWARNPTRPFTYFVVRALCSLHARAEHSPFLTAARCGSCA